MCFLALATVRGGQSVQRTPRRRWVDLTTMLTAVNQSLQPQFVGISNMFTELKDILVPIQQATTLHTAAINQHGVQLQQTNSRIELLESRLSSLEG